MSLFIKATLNYSRLIKKFFLILNLNSYGKSPEKYGLVLGVTMGRVLVVTQFYGYSLIKCLEHKESV